MARKIDLTFEARYRLLLQIANLTRDTLDLDEILNQLLDQVREIIEYDAAGIFVLTRDLVHSRFATLHGKITGIVRRGFDERPIEADPMLSLGKGIIGHVIATCESLVLPDVRLDERYVIGRQQTQSEIAVPILRNERAIGALNLESDRLSAFDSDDLDVLRFFADAAAFSIEKAMLHMQLLDKERLEDQLRTARQVQSHLLPDTPPSIPGYQLAGVNLPTYEIGGDYYDFITIDQHRVVIVVADVAGNGVPAALVMSAFRTLLRTHAKPETNLACLAESLNRMLPEFCGRGDFVTAVYAVLDFRTGKLDYVNCGHNPPLLIRAFGQAERLTKRGPALGVFPSVQYESKETSLAPDDVLVFYTDGVVEMTNSEGEFYGETRLTQVACEACLGSANDIMQAIIQDTRSFARSEIYHDDFTLIIIRREQ